MSITKLSNRIDAMNAVHSFINERIPAMRDYVKQNGYQYKAGTNDLFKKDHDALNAFLKDAPDGIHTWFNCSLYSGVSVCVKTVYAASGALDKQGNWGAEYYERSAYLGEKGKDIPAFEPFPIYDLIEWKAEAAKVPALKEQIEALQSELRRITYVTEGR